MRKELVAPSAPSLCPLSLHWLLGTQWRRDMTSPPLQDGHGPFHCEAQGAGGRAELTLLACPCPSPPRQATSCRLSLGAWAMVAPVLGVLFLHLVNGDSVHLMGHCASPKSAWHRACRGQHRNVTSWSLSPSMMTVAVTSVCLSRADNSPLSIK